MTTSTLTRIVQIDTKSKFTDLLQRICDLGLVSGGGAFDPDVLSSMPRPERDRGEIELFQLGRVISSCEDLEDEYEKRGLDPADPYSLVSLVLNDPGFAREHFLATQWKGANGSFHFLAIPDDPSQPHKYWFAGIRKG